MTVAPSAVPVRPAFWFRVAASVQTRSLARPFVCLAVVPFALLPLVSRTPLLGLSAAAAIVAISGGLTAIIQARARAGRFDLFEPVVFIPAYMLVVFGLATLPFILPLQPPSASLVFPFWVNGLQPSTLAETELLGAAATLLFMGFYLVAAARFPLGVRLPGAFLSERRLSVRRLMLAFSLGLIAKLYLIKTGHIVGIGNAFIPTSTGYLEWIQLASQTTLYAMALLAVYLLQTRPKERMLWYALWAALAVNVALGAAYGSKQILLEGLEVLIIAWWYSRRRFPPQLLAGLIFLGLVAFIIIPSYRQYVGQSAATGSADPVTAFRSAVGSSLFRASIPDLLGTDVWTIERRFALSPDVALAIQYTPAPGNPYLGGRDYIWALPDTFIPRAIWPDKPAPLNGLYFSTHYFGLPPSTSSSSSMTWMGDLYINFGLLGVFLGMGAIGMLLAWWYGAFQRNFSMQTIVIYAAAVPVIMNFEPTVPAVITSLMRDLIILALMTWLIFPPLPSKSTAARRGGFPKAWGSRLPASIALEEGPSTTTQRPRWPRPTPLTARTDSGGDSE